MPKIDISMPNFEIWNRFVTERIHFTTMGSFTNVSVFAYRSKFENKIGPYQTF